MLGINTYPTKGVAGRHVPMIAKKNTNKLNSEIKNAGLRLWMKEFIQDLNLDVHDLNMRAFQ